MDSKFSEITDFFEICRYAAGKKYELVNKCPQVFDFSIKAYYSKDEEISDFIKDKMAELTNVLSMEKYFAGVDFSKFKPEINPAEIVQMLSWISDGYMHDRQIRNMPLDFDDLMEKYNVWSEMLKNYSYRGEYL